MGIIAKTGSAVLLSLPVVVLLAAWRLWLRSAPQGWRRAVSIAAFAAAALNLAAFYGELTHDLIWYRTWALYMPVSEAAVLLCCFSIIGAVVGAGRGRLLLAFSGILGIGFWIVFTGPI